jgi:thiosulfate reductase cytochrome b subunit
MHWINALAFVLLLMSGLQIFNAHPALYWGQSSYSGRAPLLEIAGFPGWITIPGEQWLAMGRRWHLFFAWVLVINGVVYLAYTIASRHLARDLVPTRPDWRGIGRSITDHLRLRHPEGAAAGRYNILQKLAYLAVVFVLLPLMALTGWAMSPGLDSVVPHWVELLGGRQSARTIHFICAWALVAFVAVHVFEVAVTGFWNNLRSMITGRYRLPAEPGDGRDA